MTNPLLKEAERQQLERSIGADAYTIDTLRSFCTKATPESIRPVYTRFVSVCQKEALSISASRASQVGPGEMVFSYLFDNVTVGSNQPIDLFIDGNPFAEVKACSVTRTTIGDVEISPGDSRATAQLRSGLEQLNTLYTAEQGTSLPGWTGSSEVKGSLIKSWKNVSVTSQTVTYRFSSSGHVVDTAGNRVLSLKHQGWHQKLQEMVASASSKTASFSDVENQWRSTVGATYLYGKRFILLNRDDLTYLHDGPLTEANIGLLRVTRGRPKAVFYLKKEAL